MGSVLAVHHSRARSRNDSRAGCGLMVQSSTLARLARAVAAGVAALCAFSVVRGELTQDSEIDMTAYWPQPPAGTSVVIRFDSGRFGIYSRVDDHFVLDDAWHRHTDRDDRSTLMWTGRWHYRIDPNEGMLEFQD